MKRLLVLAGCILVFASVSNAQEVEEFTLPQHDPLLGHRLIQGVATPNRLWLRGNGAVVMIERATGERLVLAESGVTELLRTEGRTVAITSLEGTPGRIAVIDINTRAALTPPVEATPLALIRAGGDWVILTEDEVLHGDVDGWRRRPMEGPDHSFGVISTASTADGTIYVGFNRGEWGGGLARLVPGSNRLEVIERRDDDDLCDGPLNSDCDPVTGVIRDPDHPRCVLASIGLSHFLSRGRILQVCGLQVEEVFSQVVEQPPEEIGAGLNTWPFFGLAPSPGGWTAVSAGRLFVSSNKRVESSPLPEADERWGLGMIEMDGLIIVRTDVNWGMSVSGYTPMLIPVTD